MNRFLILAFYTLLSLQTLASNRSDLALIERVKKFNDSGQVMDLSASMLKYFKLEDFNFKDLNIPAVIKAMEPISKHEQQSSALVVVLVESCLTHFPFSGKLKEIQFNRTIYKGEIVDRKIIRSAKNYLMMVIRDHSNKMVVSYAYGILVNAFSGDKEVVDWAQKMLSAADYSTFNPNTYFVLFVLSLSAKEEKAICKRNRLFRRGLKHNRKKIRENTLKASWAVEFINQELLPDIVACFVANEDSARVAKWSARVLKTYKPEVLMKYKQEFQKGLTTDEESPASFGTKEFIEWFNKLLVK